MVANNFCVTAVAAMVLSVLALSDNARAGTYAQIDSFNGSNGSFPTAAFVAKGGVLYGVASRGGANDDGTAFQIRSQASWDMIVFASFGAKPHEGTTPQALILMPRRGENELFLGSNLLGGIGDNGELFRINSIGQKESVHYFTGGTDGSGPIGNLVRVGNVYYGVTNAGGGGICYGGSGCGTVFSFTDDSFGGTGTYKQLYAFKGGSDGAQPLGGLTYYNGVLYGVTERGGNTGCGTGCGTVFSVTPDGVETVVHRFDHQDKGVNPEGGLKETHGVLYGTTWAGGAYGQGAVFAITAAKPRQYRLVYSFGAVAGDGTRPGATLNDINGTLYGTTGFGGANGHGTIFSLTRQGVETVVYSFAGGNDGALPEAPMFVWNGGLYGTTAEGGGTGCNSLGCGTMFSYIP